jgi:N-sulfoglucosamine sulfohydrolase
MMRIFLFLSAFVVFMNPLCAETPKRNVVLMIADDLGMQLGCYGDRVARTPNIDAFAKSATRFMNAFASVASCSPSRATILTGLPTHQNGQYGLAHATHNAHSFRTVQSVPLLLQKAGYRTGVISKLHVQPAEVYPWDFQGNASGRNGVAIASQTRKFIDDSGTKPFFLLVGFTDPHRAAKGFDMDKSFKGVPVERFDPKGIPMPYHLPDTAECREEMAEFYGATARLDFGVGEVLKVLADTKHESDTVVIFLSDNGIPFPGAKTTLYDAGVHLPLIVRDPDAAKRGVVNAALASWHDVAPTILDAAGLKPATEIRGRSLRPILSTQGDTTRTAVFGSHQFHEITMYYPMRSVRTTTHKLIRNLAHPLPYPFASDLWGSKMWQGILERNDPMMGLRSRKAYEHRPFEELYDIAADPNELKNLAADPASKGTLENLRKQLLDWQKATNDPWLVKERYE